MKHATKEIRELAVSLRKEKNYSFSKISEILKYTKRTIINWLKADAEGREQAPLKRGCPPRVLTSEDLDTLRNLAEEGKCTTIDDFAKALGKGSKSTIHRGLQEIGLTNKKKQFSPAKGIAKK